VHCPGRMSRMFCGRMWRQCLELAT
jgi:hypothetical protein